MWEGPHFICAIYHRCFYSWSVLLFSMVNFKDFKIDYVAKATYDGKVVYACMTCHMSIMKKRTPGEAVYNKLYVESAPRPLQHLSKLEKYSYQKEYCSKKLK